MKKQALTISLIVNGILIILFAYSLLELKKENGKTKDKKDKATIVLFGDSIIHGGKWNDLLNRDDVITSGFCGFTTSHMIWLIQKNVIDFDPKICLIEGGINDISVGIPLKRIKKNYQSLIDTLISNNIIPIVQSTLYQENNPESKIMVDSLNYFLKNYCQQKSIRYLDINSQLSTNLGLKPEYSIDGTHITKDAYLIWGNEIKEVLSQVEIPNAPN